MSKNTKNNIISLALGTALLSFAAPAVAAPDAAVMFRPAQAWLLNTSGTIDKTCTIATTFNNGFDVRFVGSSKWVQSMDIDFQQNIFEANKIYDVTLGLPGGIKKNVRARATTPRLLSADLSRFKDFYKTVRNAPVLDFKLDDNNFRFYMTGFSSQAENFERCMAGGTRTLQPAPIVRDANAMNKTTGQTSLDLATLNEAAAMEQKETAMASVSSLNDATGYDDTTSLAVVKTKAAVPQTPVTTNSKLASAARASVNTPAVDYRAMAAAQLSGISTAATTSMPQTPVVNIENTPTSLAVTDNFATNEITKPAPSRADTLAKARTAVQDVAFKPGTRRRMSETLAEQITENPEIADVIDTPVNNNAVMAKTENAPFKQRFPTIEALSTPTDAKPDFEISVTPTNDTMMPIPHDSSKEEKVALNTILPPLEQDINIDVPKTVPVKLDSSNKVVPTPSGAKKSPDTQTIKTEIKVNKNITHGNADFTSMPIVDERIYAREAETAKRLAKLEAKLADLEGENVSLNQELRMALSSAREEDMTISSENWNLEKATMRYNEAERQLNKLGRQLQQERAQCRVEKDQLEVMLFDPQVTDQQQMAKLSDLQRQLEEAQEKLLLQRMRYEERLKMSQNSL